MAKITPEQLEDLKSGLITEPYVLEYRGDDYVFTTLTKVGLKNMRKLQENKILKEEDKETQIIELFFSHCIWPEKSVVDAIRETDSLFEPYIVKQLKVMIDLPRVELGKALQTGLSEKLKVMLKLPRLY